MSDDKLEVWLDAIFVGEKVKVGTLSHDRGHVRFNYAHGWLKHSSCFDIDPDLSLDDSTFHPDPAIGNFGRSFAQPRFYSDSRRMAALASIRYESEYR